MQIPITWLPSNLMIVLEKGNIHGNVVCQNGLNVYKQPKERRAIWDGFHIFPKSDLLLALHCDEYVLVGNVTVPLDAKVIVNDYNRCIANKVIISGIRPIKVLKCWKSREFCKLAAIHCRCGLKYIRYRTPANYQFAINHQGPHALQYIKKKYRTAAI